MWSMPRAGATPRNLFPERGLNGYAVIYHDTFSIITIIWNKTMQAQKDDVLAAISEGVIEPEAEYCPLLVFQPEGDKMRIMVDGEVCRVVDATTVKDIPMRLLTRQLGIPSAAIEPADLPGIGTIIPLSWPSKTEVEVVDHAPPNEVLVIPANERSRFRWRNGTLEPMKVICKITED